MKFFQVTFVLIVCLIQLNVNLCQAVSQQWPDQSIKEPQDFRAFYLSEGNTCNVEIVFKRDSNDGKYDYYTFGHYSISGDRLIPQTVIQDDKTQPFTVVNATANGQRGAYDLENGTTLCPIKITTCNNGGKGFITKFVVKAFEKGVDPTSNQPFWTSNPFMVNNNQIVPQSSGLSKVQATHSANTITVTWDTQNPNVKAYFIIIGYQFTQKFITRYITDPNIKSATFQGIDNPTSYAVSMNLIDSNGAVANPTACAEVSVK